MSKNNAGKGQLVYPLAIARVGLVHTTYPASYLIQLFQFLHLEDSPYPLRFEQENAPTGRWQSLQLKNLGVHSKQI